MFHFVFCFLLGIFVFVLSGERDDDDLCLVRDICFCFVRVILYFAHRYASKILCRFCSCTKTLFFIFVFHFLYLFFLFCTPARLQDTAGFAVVPKKNLFFFCICAPVRLQDTVHVERYCDIVVLHFFFIVHTDKPPGHVTSCAVVPKKKKISFLYLAHR